MSPVASIGAETAARPGRNGPLCAPRLGVAVFAVLSAMVLVVLDAGIVNIALPVLGSALRTTAAHSVWIVTAYQAGLVVALLPAGALGERFGHQRVFSFGVALFAAASGLCAISPSLPWLVAARLLQGLGGAAIMALGVALLRFSVPSARLGAAIGWNALAVALASALAPSLGATILAMAAWPALFLVNLPVAAATLVACRALPASPRSPAGLDPISMMLNASAFGLLIVAAELAPISPGASILALGAGAWMLLRLVHREAPKASPLLPLDLLRSESFRLSVIASVCCFAAQSAGLLALAFQLQHGFGLSSLSAGLHLTVWPLSVAAAALVAGRLSDRLPTAWLCAAGGAGLAVGLAGVAALQPGAPAALILPFASLAGVGFGLFQSPNNRNLFLAAPAERAGAAGGAQGSARVIGQTLGALMMSALFSVSSAGAAPTIALATAAALALAAGLVSLIRGLT